MKITIHSMLRLAVAVRICVYNEIVSLTSALFELWTARGAYMLLIFFKWPIIYFQEFAHFVFYCLAWIIWQRLTEILSVYIVQVPTCVVALGVKIMQKVQIPIFLWSYLESVTLISKRAPILAIKKAICKLINTYIDTMKFISQ